MDVSEPAGQFGDLFHVNFPKIKIPKILFSYERKEFDEIKEFDLVKDGSKILVTEDNKREFVKIFASTKMGLEIQKQVQMLIQGIHEIIPAKAISLLDEKELGLKIAGMPEINSKNKTKYFRITKLYCSRRNEGICYSH